MNDVVMTNAQLLALQSVARSMGLALDELGHPYREVQMLEEGEQIWRVVDFDPITNPGDAFRVQVYFNLAVEHEDDMVMVRDGSGPILVIYPIEDKTADGRVKAACEAVLHAAAKLLTRREAKRFATSDD